MARKKKQTWFIRIRGSYLPNSWQGWLSFVPFIGFLLLSVVGAVTSQDTIVEALYLIFPVWVAAAVVMTWIAAQKS